ncbi:hypothetical protein D3C78_1948440 [compost metagenome]
MFTPPRFQAYFAGLFATCARPVWMSRKARLIGWSRKMVEAPLLNISPATARAHLSATSAES